MKKQNIKNNINHSAMKVILVITLLSAAVFFVGRPYIIKSFTYYPLKYPGGYWNFPATHRSVKDCWIKTSDNVKLHAWHIPQPGTNKIILWFHGNGGNITNRVGQAEFWAKNLPASILLVSYRGYGKSEGGPSEDGLYIDAEAAYNYIKKRIDNTAKIIVYGQSLGGAVAIDLASRFKVSGLIVEASFTSLSDIGVILYPMLPVKWVVGDQFNSIAKISEIDCPKLFVHGDRDNIVPYEQGRTLFEKARNPKTFYTIKNGNHNNLYETGGTEYIKCLRKFLSGL